MQVEPCLVVLGAQVCVCVGVCSLGVLEMHSLTSSITEGAFDSAKGGKVHVCDPRRRENAP